MKLSRLLPLLFLLTLAYCALGVSASSNWDKDDYEIFELQNALEESEGKGTTFYSLLNVPKTASQADIKRAYRKKSLELHPDKNLGTPHAQKRFERLGLINKILRDSRKDRYDFYLSNGFPKWRKTGYFYERFRPGLVSVLFGLVLASMGVEVLIKTLNATKEKKKVLSLKRSAMLVAWGPRFEEHLFTDEQAGKKGILEKKVRVPLSGFGDLPTLLTKEDVSAGKVDWEEREKEWKRTILFASSPLSLGGRTVDVLVNRQEVLVNVDGEWWPLDEQEVVKPSFNTTWPFRFVEGIVGRKPQEETREQSQEANELETEAKNVIAAANANGNANGSEGARKRKGKKK